MIYNADCFDLLPELEDNSIDAVITDPPYGTTSCKWDAPIDLDEFWKQTKRVLRTPKSPVVVFADQPFSSALVMSNPSWFRHEWVWDKGHISGAWNAKVKPIKHTEDILVFSKQAPTYNWRAVVKERKKPRTYQDAYNKYDHTGFRPNARKSFTAVYEGFPTETLAYKSPRKETGKVHPTQKPVDLMEHLTTLYTNEGDVVLDPFMGSGTTGVAAQNLSRQFIGVEKDKIYYEQAKARMMVNV